MTRYGLQSIHVSQAFSKLSPLFLVLSEKCLVLVLYGSLLIISLKTISTIVYRVFIVVKQFFFYSVFKSATFDERHWYALLLDTNEIFIKELIYKLFRMILALVPFIIFSFHF